MRDEIRDYLFVVLPALLAVSVATAIAWPNWLSALATALAVALPALLRLKQARHTRWQQTSEHLAFTSQVLNAIPHPVYIKDAASRYIVVNQAFCEEQGLRDDQILGQTFADLAQRSDAATAWRAEDAAALAGKIIREEKHDLHPVHGGERHCLIQKASCHNAAGEVFIVGINLNISRWWMTEQDLQNALLHERTEYTDTFAFVQRVLDLIPHPVFVKDAAGFCVITNRAMVHENRFAAEQPEACGLEDQRVLAGGRVLRETRGVDDASGQEQHHIISKGSCLDARGEPVIVGVHVNVTEQRQAEHNLQISLAQEIALRQRTQAFIQSLIDNIPDPVFIKKANGRYAMINEAFAQYRMVDKLVWKGFNLDAPSQDAARRATTMSEDEQVLAGAEVEKEDHTTRKQTGEEVFRIISKRRSVFFDGDPVVVGVERHISKWRLAERELNEVLEREIAQRQRTERFVQDLIDVIPDPVYVKTGDGQYLIVNEAFLRYRKKPREEVVGYKSTELTKNIDAASLSETEDQRVIAGEVISKEQHATLPVTGEECFRIVSKRRCINVDGAPVVVGIDHYITEWRLAERALKQLAEEDMLTGIANRRHFNTEGRRALEQAHRHDEQLSIVMFDLDHFKHINDQFGHNVGDEVLREVSKRMQDAFRKSDLPGRWGGEEFIALLPHTPMRTAHQVAERLRANLADSPIATSAGDLRVTLSGGAANRQTGDTLESLVARADAALYRAKNDGRNRIEMGDEEGAE